MSCHRMLWSQVWALYDDCDGMPRFHVYIHRANKTSRGYKWSCSWLEGRGGRAGAKMNVNGMRVSPGCGLFGHSRRNQQDSVAVFSHLVGVGNLLMEKGKFGIWPMRDQVWAMFSEGGGGKGKKKLSYDLVVITEDYSEESGPEVRFLEKQEDKKTIFRVSSGVMYSGVWVYAAGGSD